MLTGSLGILPSTSLGAPDPDTGRRRALYEPAHGSSPNIAGPDHPPVSTTAMGDAILAELDARAA